MSTRKPDYCCDELADALPESELFRVTDDPVPRLIVMSDGGHGGSAHVKFCPFCGKKIEFTPLSAASWPTRR